MPVRKADVVSSSVGAQAALMTKFEAEIDGRLRKFTPGEKVSMSIPVGLYKETREKIMERYRAEGWTVEYFDSQRDGDGLVFS